MKRILKNAKFFHILLILIFALALFLRADMYVFNRPFWFDEAALAINVLDNSFPALFKELSYFQSAPPMFLFETKVLILLFGDSERVFRFIPFLASLLSLPLFYALSRYFLSNPFSRLFALFLFAINTNLIFYSGEFKPYALDVFALISFLLLVFIFKFKKPLLCGVLFALMLWYSYASGIVALCVILVLLSLVIKTKKT